MFQTSVRGFFLNCHRLKTWFELSRVKLYGNYLKGSKNYFESVRGKNSKHVCRKSRGNQWTLVRDIGSQLLTDTENGFWEISKVLRGTSCYCFPLKINVVAVG